MTIILKNKETLKFDDFYFKCCIGKKGLSITKKEGDKKTPTGEFSLGYLYYRKDRIIKPITKLKSIPISKKMGWCDDERDEKYYNKLINRSLSGGKGAAILEGMNSAKGEYYLFQDGSRDLVLFIIF